MNPVLRPTPEQRLHAFDLLSSGSAPVVDKASAQWILLRNLERNFEVDELMSSGISKNRIESLYPLNFQSVVPGIIEFVTPQKYVSLDGSELWQVLGAYPKNIVRELPELHRSTDAEASRFLASETYKALHAHLEASLAGEDSTQRAKAMALGLWYGWWGMANLEGTRWWRSMCKAFVSTVDWVLPELR